MSAAVYEEVEIEDMKFDVVLQAYTYPCPCGDIFSILLEELHDGEDIATCPSCTLRIRVVFDADKLPPLPGEGETVEVVEAVKPVEAEPASGAEDVQKREEAEATAPEQGPKE